MPTPSKIFVASSGEAERLAQAIQQNLRDAEVTLWTQHAFRIGHVIIDELNRNLQQSDFGVFLFAPNDVVMIRGQKQQAVRDNVVLELGMFIGRLGKERSFIVQPKGVNMRLPTDLLGVITGQYDQDRAEREPVAALGTACTQIADAIKRQHKRKTRELDQLIRCSGDNLPRDERAGNPRGGEPPSIYLSKGGRGACMPVLLGPV